MNKSFRKWLACTIAITIAVYNAPYSMEALEVIGDSVQLEENNDIQGNDVNQTEEEKLEDTTEQDQSDGVEKQNAGSFVVSGEKDKDWKYENNVLTILSGATNIKIKGNGFETKDRIVVEAGYQGTVTIENINIVIDSEEYKLCAFEVKTSNGNENTSKTKLTLELIGENFLTSGDHRAGLEFSNAYIDKNNKDMLEYLNIKGNGKLTAKGGQRGAGIGGGIDGDEYENGHENGNNINILEGTITAIGGIYGAGIGGGSLYGNGSNIIISGGNVKAEGGMFGAGIGGGMGGNGNDIKISKGTVTALGGNNGAGIGGGDKGNGSNIIISGGSVKAEGRTRIDCEPKNESGVNVYLVKLDYQDNFKEGDPVKVTNKTTSGVSEEKDYNVVTNHEGDSSFYLYMPEGTYTITTHNGSYKYRVNSNGGKMMAEAPDPSKMIVRNIVTNTKKALLVDVSNYKDFLQDGNIICSLNDKEWKKEEKIDNKRQVLLELDSNTEKETQTIYIRCLENQYLAESESSNKDFKLGKVTIKDSAYTGNPMTKEDIVESNSKGEISSLTYYQENINGNWEDLDSSPIDVGRYKVKAILEAKDGFTAVETEEEFKITQATNSWKEGGELKIDDSIYGGMFNEPKADAKFGDEKYTYSTEENGTYSETVPKNAGTYYVKAIVVGTKNYTDLESKPISFKIEKANSTVTITTQTLNKIYDGKAVSNPEYTKLGSNGKVTIKWQEKSATAESGWKDLDEAPSTVGSYRVVVELAGNNNYNPASATLEFEISQAEVPDSGIGNVPPKYEHTSIIGSDRYETAGKIADKLGSYDTAVLVNATSTMSDGLSAAGLAGKEDAAILLTKKDSIPKATMDRLKKVKKVYIIGGENAISRKVSDEITKNVPNVKIERLGGKTRVETSELVAKEIGNYKKAFVVNGFKGEADAMSASAVAAREEAPILLTNGKTSTHDKKSGVEYYVVGGNAVVDKSIANKYNAKVLSGDDRYKTNRKVVNEFYGGSETLYFANGETLVDALTASTIAKDDGLVLVGRKSDNSILNRKNTIQVGGMNFDVDFEK